MRIEFAAGSCIASTTPCGACQHNLPEKQIEEEEEAEEQEEEEEKEERRKKKEARGGGSEGLSAIGKTASFSNPAARHDFALYGSHGQKQEFFLFRRLPWRTHSVKSRLLLSVDLPHPVGGGGDVAMRVEPCVVFLRCREGLLTEYLDKREPAQKPHKTHAHDSTTPSFSPAMAFWTLLLNPSMKPRPCCSSTAPYAYEYSCSVQYAPKRTGQCAYDQPLPAYSTRQVR